MTPFSLDRPLRVRFASSADALTLGAARTALFAWMLARRSGGAFVLRSDAGATTGNGPAPDLRALGIPPDEGPADASADGRAYRDALIRLLATGATYEREGAVRLRMPEDGVVVPDLVHGEVTVHGVDPVVHRPDGTAPDTLAAVLADARERVDVVVEGDERLERGARYIVLARALGLEPPRFAHASRVLDAGERVADLLAQGYLPQAILAHLALLGYSPADGREHPSVDELARAFDPARMHASPAHHDPARLRTFNARALRALPRERYHALLAERMQRAGLLEDPIPDAAQRWIETFLDAFGASLHTLGEGVKQVAEMRAEAVTIPALELERLRNRQVLFFLDAVAQYVDDQPELRGLPLAHDLAAIADEFGIAHDDAFAAVRMALTASHDGPPLTLLFPLLGHDRILIRIGAVSSHILHGRGLEPIRYGPGGVPFETIQPTKPGAEATGGERPGL